MNFDSMKKPKEPSLLAPWCGFENLFQSLEIALQIFHWESKFWRFFPTPKGRREECVVQRRVFLALPPAFIRLDKKCSELEQLPTSYILNRPEFTLPQLGTPEAIEKS